uniref:Peptidase M14 domain-containing protein n=1 Tax=Phlebotomus papatasi TaxID=29031 RepID=A0A1B0DE41_PHLPP
MIQNMQDLIDKERPDKAYSDQEDEEFGWTDYYDTQTIHEWLYSMEELYDEVTIIKAGTTYEGRDILGVNINRNPGQNPVIHSLAWICDSMKIPSVAVSSWLIIHVADADYKKDYKSVFRNQFEDNG